MQPVTAQIVAAEGGASAKPNTTQSSKASPLYWITKNNPTNYNMLAFRTINRDLNRPNSNEDHLAGLLSDKLMPIRSKWLKCFPGMLKPFKRALEHKRFGTPGVANFVDARTKWFDAAVREALQEGITQVVCVAAGFDTRAYRFGAEGVSFYEIDLPHASKKKQELVEKLFVGLPRPTFVGADLSTVPLQQALVGTGFDATKKTLFTVEGLIYYLPPAAVTALFGAIAELSAPGSRVYFDYLHQEDLMGTQVPPTPAYTVTARSVANKGEAFISGIPSGSKGLDAFVADIPIPAASSTTDSLAFRVKQHMGPHDMVTLQLPHEKWDESLPPILAFYSFAALERM